MGLTGLPHRFWRKYVYQRHRHRKGVHKIHFGLIRLAEKGLERMDEPPQSIFERGDWDNLVILDACRHDLYEEVTGKEVPKRTTLGSFSREYVKRTYRKGDFSDIVYINGNPYLSDQKLEKYFGHSDLFHVKYDTLLNVSNERGVPPEFIVRDAVSAEKLYPDKKKIIHFMQPHRPYIGNDFEERIPDDLLDAEDFNLYDIVYQGYATREEVVQAYKGTLEYVLDYVNEVNDFLLGRTVVTADHGQYLGENHLYRHHNGSETKLLREVPWDVISE